MKVVFVYFGKPFMKVRVHHRPGLNSKSFLSVYSMSRKHIVLFIVNRPSDGDVKPGGPFVLFEKSRL